MSAEDEKTRVLQRPPAKEAASAPAEREKVFRCPNGHRIVVPESQVGKRGPCPKCKLEVTVPEGQGDELVFYCPNGHRQFAQASKAGSLAQCGNCKITLTIPRPGDPPTPRPAVATPPAPAPPPPPVARVPDLQFQPPPEPVVDDAAAAEPEGGGDDAPPVETWDFIGGKPAEQPAAGGFEPAAWPSADSEGGLTTDGGHATAMLVGRLWAERQHGGVIELHLAGGSVILPDWYDANWSRGTHGLFASQAADGSVTLTAVAWETVQKIVVRQLTEVPNDMFT